MKISIRLYIVVVIILLFADPGRAMIDPGTIIAAWHFDEGEGKVIRDSEGKRISGVVMGTGEWVDCMSGKALRFNGRNTYVIRFYTHQPGRPVYRQDNRSRVQLRRRVDNNQEAGNI